MEGKFVCSHCGTEYEYNPNAIRRYKVGEQDILFQICPKDGSPVFLSFNGEEVEDGGALIGEAIVGKATIK